MWWSDWAVVTNSSVVYSGAESCAQSYSSHVTKFTLLVALADFTIESQIQEVVSRQRVFAVSTDLAASFLISTQSVGIPNQSAKSSHSYFSSYS